MQARDGRAIIDLGRGGRELVRKEVRDSLGREVVGGRDRGGVLQVGGGGKVGDRGERALGDEVGVVEVDKARDRFLDEGADGEGAPTVATYPSIGFVRHAAQETVYEKPSARNRRLALTAK